ncbi:MAG: hypothetical protein ABMA64_20395 [Myxococcota bacterium]
MHGPARAVVEVADDRGQVVATVDPGGVDAWVQLPELGVGWYGLTLVAGGAVRATSEVWVVDPAVGPTLAAGPGPTVQWRGAPGNRWDWVSASPAGRPSTASSWWAYTGATVDGSAPLPLGPGSWDLYLLEDDSDRVLAFTSVTLP